MERDTIELVLVEGIWHARYSGAHRAEVVDLFGTDTLPTPYTASRLGVRVAAIIAELNPGVLVTVPASGWEVAYTSHD